MTTAEQQRLAGLERQVAEMGAQIEYLQGVAFFLRTVEEQREVRYAARMGAPATRSPRPRHLSAISGGAS